MYTKIVSTALVISALALAGCEQSVNHFDRDNTPATLSSWGILDSNGTTLAIHVDSTPYDLNSPLFTDYAHKLRTLYLPEGTAAVVKGDRIEFPVGSIITKTFYYPKGASDGEVVKTNDSYLIDGSSLNLADVQLIETRLLVKQADGWQALPYVWNADQSDATLEIAGDVQAKTLVDGNNKQRFAYVVPDANQCGGCHAPDHTSASIMPIGPKPSNLNGEFSYASGLENQLTYWFNKGLLQETIEPTQTLAIYEDGARDQLDLRARSYLDANCAHCHNPKGAADTSGLMLHIEETDMRAIGLCKPPVAAGRGAGSRPFSLFASHPDKSIMVYRMQSDDPGEMMPEIGRSLQHKEGVALIADWIGNMDPVCE